jgi:hypothetical protein
MATTTNLAITLIEEAQADKEVTANTAISSLDAFVATRNAISVAGTGDIVLTAANVKAQVIELTGLLTGARNVIFPNGSRWWIIFNNTTGAFSVTLKRSGQTGFVIGQGKHCIAYYNGTDIARVTADNP